MTLLQQLYQRLPKSWQQPLSAWWSARSMSERRTLILGAVAALLIVVVSLAMNVWNTQRRLANQLPALRHTAAQSQYWAERFVLQQPRASEPLGKMLQKAQAMFASEGFLRLEEAAAMRASADNTYTLPIHGASLGAFLRWSEHLEQHLGLRIKSVNLQEQADGKSYSGDMVVGN